MDPTAPSCPIVPGTVVAAKYRVERIIGIGGMGVVVAARHLELDDRVALKFLLPQALGNAEVVTRFAREARAAVKIKSQHVARTLDVGRLDDGSPFIVMEYLEGVDLATRLRTHGPLGVASAIALTLQTCEALADAHVLGIIHRDLKPANLFLTRNSDGSECVKVLDFGISKITENGGNSIALVVTNTAAMMGSPMYMAPEQMESARSVDARSDIWSLGVTLFELLSAERPFGGENIAQLCAQITSGTAPSICKRRADVPAGLDRVVQHCLEKDRDRRYANVGELAHALREFAPPEALISVDRISRVLAAAGVNSPEQESAPATEREQQTITSIDPTVASVLVKRHPSASARRALILAAAMVVLAVVVAGATWRRNDYPPGRGGAAPILHTTSSAPMNSRGFASATGPSVVPTTLSPRSEPPRATSASTRHVMPPRALPNHFSASTTASALPVPTVGDLAKPTASDKLPDLGGDGREF